MNLHDREAFLAKIEEAPDEQTAKLVYADWLQEQGFELEAAFWRGEATMTREQFDASIIAQDDDNDYQESGYVACVVERDGFRIAFLVRYSHCSCYGTWEALTDASDWMNGPPRTFRPDWIGTVEQLVDMAKRTADPVIPSRTASRDDYDFDHLEAVYAEVLKWADSQEKTPVMRCEQPGRKSTGNCTCEACLPGGDKK